MKKILTVLIIAVLVGGFALQSAAVQPKNVDYATPGPKIKIWFLIEFGRQMFDCKRFSICHVSGGWKALEAIAGPTAKNSAYGEVYMDEGSLVVEFLVDNMGKDTRSIYFDSIFKMEDSFKIPKEILNQLKYEGDYVINPGDYPILDTKSRLIVRF